eukprot:1160308-Pelagomonas_calceolata.AAC.5
MENLQHDTPLASPGALHDLVVNIYSWKEARGESAGAGSGSVHLRAHTARQNDKSKVKRRTEKPTLTARLHASRKGLTSPPSGKR